jgi:hypothetical protein
LFLHREQIKAMCELEGTSLRAFGYDPLTQNFPNVSSLPQTKTQTAQKLTPLMTTTTTTPQAILSLPPYERCVKFLDKSAPPPPAGTEAPAGAAPSPALVVNKGAS